MTDLESLVLECDPARSESYEMPPVESIVALTREGSAATTVRRGFRPSHRGVIIWVALLAILVAAVVVGTRQLGQSSRRVPIGVPVAKSKVAGPEPATAKRHAPVRNASPPSKSTSAGDLFPISGVVMLQMFDTSSGVGIGELGDEYYLVDTHDGGASWIVGGAVPNHEYAKSNAVTPFVSSLVFENDSDGYFDNGNGDPIYTDNGGRTWARISTEGLSGPVQSQMSMSQGDVWLLLADCSTSDADATCKDQLLTYRFGSMSPSSVRPISTGTGSGYLQVVMLDRSGPDSGIVAVGEDSTDLLSTTDGGRHWSPVNDACAHDQLIAMGLAEISTSHWVLYCQLDGGMEQGVVEVFRSLDSGQAWTLVDYENESNIGTIGDVGHAMAADLTLSGDRRILWDVGEVEGIGCSPDDGVKWDCGVPLVTGGYSSPIATAGATEAWLPADGVIYHTVDGVHWSKLS